MPIRRERKEELIAEYVELLKVSNGFAVLSVAGLSVTKTQALRKKIYEAGGQYVVTKNTLIRKALEELGWAVPVDSLQGPSAIVFGKEDFSAVAKAILEHLKTEDFGQKLYVKGGVFDKNEVLNAAGVEAVSTLPSLPELQAQIIGLIVAPARNIVTILHQADSGIVNVLQALLDKDKEDGAA